MIRRIFSPMVRHSAMKSLCSFLLAVSFAMPVHAQPQDSLRRLPPPDTTGGKPLMQILKDRRTQRSFSDRSLPEQVLSNLLWAANGINRPDGRRTAPSARNWQEIDIYVALESGLFVYEPSSHALRLVLPGDIRSATGAQDFVRTAPVNLVYVADLTKAGPQTNSDNVLFVGADCGFIAENVYLYCASEGLATVVRGMVNRTDLAKVMKLRADQKILLSQTIGFPR
jgi:SagB-type dehydrogenase family enzyme